MGLPDVEVTRSSLRLVLRCRARGSRYFRGLGFSVYGKHLGPRGGSKIRTVGPSYVPSRSMNHLGKLIPQAPSLHVVRTCSSHVDAVGPKYVRLGYIKVWVAQACISRDVLLALGTFWDLFQQSAGKNGEARSSFDLDACMHKKYMTCTLTYSNSVPQDPPPMFGSL